MAKLIVWNIMSLDGYFEGSEKWDLRQHEHIWGEDLRQLSLQFSHDHGLLVFGRVTYEGMAAHWSQAEGEDPEITAFMNSAPKLVASRSLTEATWQNTEVTADIVAELTRRKKIDDRPIYVFGSAELTHSLLEAGLVDELLVGVAPVLLGRGTPLFKPAAQTQPLSLVENRTLDSGGALLRFALKS